MQAFPQLTVDGEIVVASSTASQSRGPHGAFRYFGKLAPDVTGAVLDLALTEIGNPARARVLDPMCGSGTTLLEAQARGAESTGTDVNPVALLYAAVKTRSVDEKLTGVLTDMVADRERWRPDTETVFRATRNAERWFTPTAKYEVAGMLSVIDSFEGCREKDFLRAVLLSRLRRISNASARTGRIFYDPNSARPAVDEFLSGVREVLPRTPSRDIECELLLRDARLPSGVSRNDVVFIHPPYFALYRYSSDVLRFEMEIGGYSRRDTARAEIAEGWKSGDPANLDAHVADMRAIFASAAKSLRPGGVVSLVASNSTLGDTQLPVIDRLADAGMDVGLRVVKHFVRRAHHGSASYHRSARPDKVIHQDHVLLLRLR